MLTQKRVKRTTCITRNTRVRSAHENTLLKDAKKENENEAKDEKNSVSENKGTMNVAAEGTQTKILENVIRVEYAELIVTKPVMILGKGKEKVTSRGPNFKRFVKAWYSGKDTMALPQVIPLMEKIPKLGVGATEAWLEDNDKKNVVKREKEPQKRKLSPFLSGYREINRAKMSFKEEVDEFSFPIFRSI